MNLLEESWKQFINVLGRILIIPELKKQNKKLQFELDFEKEKNNELKNENKILEKKVNEKGQTDEAILNKVAEKYDYLIVSTKSMYGTRFYHRGQEIKNLKSIDFEHHLNSCPNINLEV